MSVPGRRSQRHAAPVGRRTVARDRVPVRPRWSGGPVGAPAHRTGDYTRVRAVNGPWGRRRRPSSTRPPPRPPLRARAGQDRAAPGHPRAAGRVGQGLAQCGEQTVPGPVRYAGVDRAGAVRGRREAEPGGGGRGLPQHPAAQPGGRAGRGPAQRQDRRTDLLDRGPQLVHRPAEDVPDVVRARGGAAWWRTAAAPPDRRGPGRCGPGPRRRRAVPGRARRRRGPGRAPTCCRVLRQSRSVPTCGTASRRRVSRGAGRPLMPYGFVGVVGSGPRSPAPRVSRPTSGSAPAARCGPPA